MPIDTRRESRVVAVVDADVTGGGESDLTTLRATLDRVNRTFREILAEAFSATASGRFDGALTDPSRVPACLSVLREGLAPLGVRAGVGIGVVGFGAGPADGPDAYAQARRALRLAIREGGLTRYLGTGEAGDVLLAAVCRLVDPILRARSPKQWEAVAAYRELGHQQAVAGRLGVTRQSVGERLTAGRWRDVEEADVAVSDYLGLVAPRRGPA
jgi:hypothetical protein